MIIFSINTLEDGFYILKDSGQTSLNMTLILPLWLGTPFSVKFNCRAQQRCGSFDELLIA